MTKQLLVVLLVYIATAECATKVHNLHCISEIQARFAITDILSAIENDGALQDEVTYELYLPERAFISSFSIEVNGITTYGTIKEKEKARLEYEEARRNNIAAGLIEQTHDKLPRETKKFLMKVNVPPRARAQFNMTYQEMLRREHGVYKHIINVRPHRHTVDVQVDVLVAEKTKFRVLQETATQMHVPQWADDLGYLTNDQLLRRPKAQDVEVRSTEQPGGSLAYAYYQPPQGFQAPRLNGQMVLLFDIERGATGGTIQTYDGYFLQSIAPENVPVGNKNVIFVIDKSGSMKGRKIAQVKKAMETILQDLHPTDKFNVLMFSNVTQPWVDSLVLANDHNKGQAKTFVQNARAFGGTDIHGSIMEALTRLSRGSHGNALTSFVIFLTDGKATVGKTNRHEIVDLITTANKDTSSWPQKPRYAIHGIGFGNNADMQLLQQIAGANDGVARRVVADSDADIQLKGVFQQFSSPLLRDLEVKYVNGAVDVGSLVRPDEGAMFFDGGEVVVAGKVNNPQQNLQFDSVVTGTGKNGNVQLKQSTLKGSNSECYPDFNFQRNDGSAAPTPQHIALCSGAKPRTVVVSATPRSSSRQDRFRGRGRFRELFGGDDALNNFFNSRASIRGRRPRPQWGNRNKRQVEQVGNGPDRQVGAANSIGGFIERTWAYLTIRKLTKESEEWHRQQSDRDEKAKRATQLSLKYGFVSKFTSMVVVHGRHAGNPGNTPNELLDVPASHGGGLAPQDDQIKGRGNNDIGKRVVNALPSKNGTCHPGVILTIESHPDSSVTRSATSLVRRIKSHAAFNDATIVVTELLPGGDVHVRHSANQPQTLSAITTAIGDISQRRQCRNCRGFADLAPYVIRTSEGVRKAFVVFTGHSSSLGSFGTILKGLIMPKIMVPTVKGEFAPLKLAGLQKLTTDNEILYEFNENGIIDLLEC